MSETTALAVKLGMELFKHTAPKGIARLRTWLKEKEILVVGPPEAGKTTFIDYLRYGLLESEKKGRKTYEPKDSANFIIEMGKSQSLTLYVRNAHEVPGHTGPIFHAQTALDRKPHGIVIIVDLTLPLSGEDSRAGEERTSDGWLKVFCRHLEEQWSVRRKSWKRLRSLVVVMNKADKVEPERIKACRNRLEEVVGQELRFVRENLKDPIQILPCVLIKNSKGTELADDVVTSVAKELAG